MQMYNVKESKSNITSKSHTVSVDELRLLLDSVKGVDKILVIGLGYCGMREGELIHMRYNWIKHNKEDLDVESFGIPHIEIPSSGTIPCECNDCRLRKFIATQKTKGEHYTVEWYRKKQKKYYRLKRKNKLPELKSVWRPKSAKGERRIPLIESDTIPILLDYFVNHKKINMDRFQVWSRVSKMGQKYLEKKIFPHSLRATFGTHLARKGVNMFALKNVMGHMHIDTTDQYIETDKHIAFKEIKAVYKL